MCLFSIEIQTPGSIRMKFGTEVVLEGGEGSWGGHPQLSRGSSPYRTPNSDLEGPGPSVTHFQGKFIK